MTFFFQKCKFDLSWDLNKTFFVEKFTLLMRCSMTSTLPLKDALKANKTNKPIQQRRG